MGVNDCLEYAEELSSIVAEVARRRRCDCMLFSGGIDTSFVALSLSRGGVEFSAITVAFPGAVDLGYSRIPPERLGFSREVVYVTPESVEGCLKIVLRALRTIDPIEVVSDIPICIGLKRAIRLGCNCILTGDGGDELFLGYDFLLHLRAGELELWLNRVKGKRYFSSERIGRYMGLSVVPGLFAIEVKEYSKKIPMECRINNYSNRRWGKYLLRIFLDRHGFQEIAWREKTPISSGSGSETLLRSWGRELGIGHVKVLSRESGVYFPSRAHAYLYAKLLEYGVEPQDYCGDPHRICPICGRCMNGGHCGFCGASVGGGSGINMYTDGLLWELLGCRS